MLKARVNASENANNTIEHNALFDYIENTGMVSLEGNDKCQGDSSESFLYHPSGDKDLGQLWQPFYAPFKLISGGRNTVVAEGLVEMNSLVNAMKCCKKRLVAALSSTAIKDIQIDFDITITPAAKLWEDSHVYSSTIFTQRLSLTNKRGSEYVLFHAIHKNG